MSDTRGRPSLTILVPCFNEAEVFARLRGELTALADRLAPDFVPEILFVDDGSQDATWSLIRDFAASDPRVAGVALTRNFGHQAALTCGYDLAGGDAVVSMDADLQDPPTLVVEMVAQWSKGADVVLAVREDRVGETRFKRWSSTLFYRTLRLLGAPGVRPETGEFRLLSRRAVLALRALRERHRFLRGLVGWLAFPTVEVPYRRPPRFAGRSKYGLRQMLRLALDAAVASGVRPLRIASALSVLCGTFSLALLGWALLAHRSSGQGLDPAWTALLLSVTGFGVATLLCLGVLGEYVGRLHEQSQDRPLYVVREAIVAGLRGPR